MENASPNIPSDLSAVPLRPSRDFLIEKLLFLPLDSLLQ